MLIGILSDSHGHHAPVRRAVALFDALRVEHIIHCGDVGGIGVFDELVGRPLTFVWGNCDRPNHALVAYLDAAGVTVPTEAPQRITLGGKRFVVFHGHEPGFPNRPDGLGADYLLHGHTHVARDDRIEKTRIINPGALHRARTKTVATFDTERDLLEFHEIPTG